MLSSGILRGILPPRTPLIPFASGRSLSLPHHCRGGRNGDWKGKSLSVTTAEPFMYNGFWPKNTAFLALLPTVPFILDMSDWHLLSQVERQQRRQAFKREVTAQAMLTHTGRSPMPLEKRLLMEQYAFEEALEQVETAMLNFDDGVAEQLFRAQLEEAGMDMTGFADPETKLQRQTDHLLDIFPLEQLREGQRMMAQEEGDPNTFLMAPADPLHDWDRKPGFQAQPHPLVPSQEYVSPATAEGATVPMEQQAANQREREYNMKRLDGEYDLPDS